MRYKIILQLFLEELARKKPGIRKGIQRIIVENDALLTEIAGDSNLIILEFGDKTEYGKLNAALQQKITPKYYKKMEAIQK